MALAAAALCVGAAPGSAPDERGDERRVETVTEKLSETGAEGNTPAGVPAPFTVAVLPDTQHFSDEHPDIYHAMCRWIAANAEARNIVFVVHVGDVVHEDEPRQWAAARRAHDVLARAGLPQGVAIGNHDYDPAAPAGELGASFLANFGPDAFVHSEDPASERFRDQPWWGGHSPSGLSSYQLLPPERTGGVPMLFLSVECDLKRDEVAWAATVIDAHPDRAVVITTHRYLYDFRILAGRYGPWVYTKLDPLYTTGEGNTSVGAGAMHDRLVARFPNVAMVLCGHSDGEFRTSSTNAAGLPVHEILQDYQTHSPRGGNGWIRLYEFDVAAGQVRAETFSPVVDGGRLRTRADQLAELPATIASMRERAVRKLGFLRGLLGGPATKPAAAATEPAQRQGQAQTSSGSPDETAGDGASADTGLAAIESILGEGTSASDMIRGLRTGEGVYAWAYGALAALEGAESSAGKAARMAETLRTFPYDDITPGLITLMDIDSRGVVRALNGHPEGLVWQDLSEIITDPAVRAPSFTLELDLAGYPSEPITDDD